ncbi:MAG TPA: SMP-30/gluconolactonase/LRE family protein [Bryobacteraceae bacterium]|jgi:D-xylonolactonase|nr:SMP-30/gluconolactonase/LRE family protein [Bryobacteraceae bacterium]
MNPSDITILAETHDQCGEGPLWDARRNCLYWVDIITERLHIYNWQSRAIQMLVPGVPTSALALTEDGQVVIAGAKGVWLWTENEGALAIATSHEGKTLAINDAIADPAGRLLAGSTFFDGTSNYPRGNLYVIERDGGARVLDSGFGLANGLGFTGDGRTLYFTDSVDRVIYAYDYDAGQGQVGRRRVFVQVPATEGIPDGLTVDAEGFVWSAQWFGACICRYDPDGKLERRIAVPAEQTSSLAFGGPDMTDIFITTAATPDALVLAPPGYAQKTNVGGQLFHLNLGIPGQPEHYCRISRVDH